MKFTIVIALVAFIASANAATSAFKEKFLTEVHDVGLKCVGEVGATQGDFDGLIAHKIPESQEGKCLIFCIYKYFKVQNADGSLNMEGALDTLDKMKDLDPDLFDKLVKVAAACGTNDLVASDGCVTAANIHACGIEQGKKLGISSDVFEL